MKTPQTSLLAACTALLAIGCGPTPNTTEPAQDPKAAPPPPVVRVLYVENLPRWEYRYLKNALRRTAGIEFQSFLYAASDDFPQDASPGLPYLEKLPSTTAELARYDVVLLGDVAPEQMLQDAAERTAWFERLAAFVDAGGGLAFLSGPDAMPELYRGTALEPLLPVELDAPRTPAAAAAPQAAFIPQLADPTHPITMLAADPATNARLWHEGFPPLQMYYPVARLRKAAEPLLLHPADSNQHGPRVIAAAMTSGKGRTFFLGTDDAWRWRRVYGEKYHDKMWNQAVRYLAGK